MRRTSKWVNFYGPDGKCLGGYTVKGTFPGELEATKEIIAAENDIKTDDITVRYEGD